MLARINNIKFFSVMGAALSALSIFIFSFLLLSYDSVENYGFFAFLIVIQALSNGVSNALLHSPFLSEMKEDSDHTLFSAYFTVSYFVSFLVGVVYFFIAIYFVDLFFLSVICFFLGFTSSHRWFVRGVFNNLKRNMNVVFSDLIFSISSLMTVLILWLVNEIDLESILLTSVFSSILSLLPLMSIFYAPSFNFSNLSLYGRGFRHTGRYALVGVFSSELIANLHSYLIMFVYGPAKFAPIAAAMLVFRPINLINTTLSQLERPKIRSYILLNNVKNARIRLKNFISFSLVSYFFNLALVVFVALYCDRILWPDTGINDMIIYCLIFLSAINFVKCFRMPISVYLQAGQYYKEVSFAAINSAASVLLTMPFFVFYFDVEFSLLSIFAAEVVFLFFLYFTFKR